MKVAIASCFNPKSYPNQPVWDNIKAKQPNTLVLLGDSVYLDIPWIQTVEGMIHPSDAWPQDFLKHGHELYKAQLAEPHFSSLIASVPKTFAIWDDHDFLWNNAAGDSLSSNLYRGHFQATRCLLKAYRSALTARNANSFPATHTDPALNGTNEPAPGYQFVDLGENVSLHLTDGRSFRNKHQLLGSAQRAQITNAMESNPGRINLVASGNVLTADKGERWTGYPEDFEWIKRMAVKHRILVLSGDVHENRIPAPVKIAGGHDIYEITSSGAAIGALVAHGDQKHNFGLIEIADGNVVLSTYKDNPAVPDTAKKVIALNQW